MVASTPRRRAGNWSAKLTRPLILKDGTKLVTLEHARRVLLAHLVAEVEDHESGSALRLLLIAAETGTLAARRAATDEVANVLR